MRLRVGLLVGALSLGAAGCGAAGRSAAVQHVTSTDVPAPSAQPALTAPPTLTASQRAEDQAITELGQLARGTVHPHRPILLTPAPPATDPATSWPKIEAQCQALAQATFTAPPSPTSAGTVADGMAQESRMNAWIARCEQELEQP